MALSVNPHDSLPVIRDAVGDIGVLAVTSVDPATGVSAPGAGSSDEVYWGGNVYTKKTIKLDVLTDPDEILAAGGATSAYVILHLFATNKGSANVQFTLDDSTGALTHEITAGANGGGGGTTFAIQCATNSDLDVNIVAGTATDLGLTLTYIDITP